MTEQTKDVPTQVTEETLAPPTPVISPASEQASSAETGFDAVAFEERITAKLDEFTESLPGLVDARFKSTTDKPHQDVRKIAEYLKKFGGDVEVAAREMAIDRLLEGRETEARVPGRTPARSTQADFAARTEEILEEAGIPLDDPEVLEMQKSPVANEGDWYRKLTKLGIKRAKQGGVTASATIGSAGKASAPIEGDALLAEITELQRHPVANQKAIAEKMKQAREAGLFD